MKNKFKTIVLIFSLLVITVFSITQVYAQTIGLDLATLVRNKIMVRSEANTAQAIADIEKKREQVESMTASYVDSYMSSTQKELEDYTKQQKNIAQTNMESAYNDVKKELEANRKSIMDDAKQNIKTSIDVKYSQEQEKLNSNIAKMLNEKLK